MVSLADPSDEQMIFRREGLNFTFSAEFCGSVEDPKFLDYVAKGTRANQLFLNEAHERDLSMIEPVYRWFAHTLVIIGPDTQYGPLVEDADLAPMLYLAKEQAPVYVVDELDRSLHTLLAERLIERFIAETGAADGDPAPQLIFTTHDTNLLDCRRLGPESIWFAEKNLAGASEFYSLAEYQPEQLALLCGNLKRAYLQGRFGGIPLLGDPERLGSITLD